MLPINLILDNLLFLIDGNLLFPILTSSLIDSLDYFITACCCFLCSFGLGWFWSSTRGLETAKMRGSTKALASLAALALLVLPAGATDPLGGKILVVEIAMDGAPMGTHCKFAITD